MVFQGRAFWEYATPLFHKHFPHTKDVTAAEFYRYINRVQPGLIRVNADEGACALAHVCPFGLLLVCRWGLPTHVGASHHIIPRATRSQNLDTQY